MAQPCAIVSCKETSRVLCYCCDRNLCLDHFSSHSTLAEYQSHSLPDQVKLLNEQLKRLDRNKLMEDGRRKLDQWRDENLKKLDRFYEQKCEELDRYYLLNIRQKQIEMDQLHQNLSDPNRNTNDIHEDYMKDLQSIILDTKKRVDAIEQKGIPIIVHSLSMSNNFISVGDSKSQGFHLAMLSLPPYHTFDCRAKFGSALANSDRLLLIDQNPILSLYQSDLKTAQQSPWKNEKSKAFLVDENNLSITIIEEMQNQLWISCTCSNSLLYLSSLSNGVVEFSLVPSISYVKRWDPPMTCKLNESIKDIACNDVTLALLVSPPPNKTVHIILRSLATFDELFTVHLDIRQPLYQLPTRCCPLKNSEWLVVDANTSQLIHITQDGKVKGALIYDHPPHNAVLFNSDKLVIRTEDAIHFHQLFN